MSLVKMVEKARERYHSHHGDWQDVIDAIVKLVPKRDMAKFGEFCNEEEYGLGGYDNDGVTNLRMALDIKKEDENGLEDNSNGGHRGWYEDTPAQCAPRDGFLARKMWKGYKDWLDHHPEELERFKQFVVRSWSFTVLVQHVINY